MLLFAVLFTLQSAIPQDRSAPQAVTADWIVSQMVAHDAWQDRNLLEYHVLQHFDAKNDRFKVHASRDVETSFHTPKTEYKIVKDEGNRIIRSDVFNEVMKAEAETDTKQAREQSDIRPGNYTFELQGTDDCSGRKCYRLKLIPRHKDKYSLDGAVWIDAEDFAITRILARPAKSPSWWIIKSEIDQHFKKVNGFWLPDFMDSWSDMHLVGHSTFRIDYKDYTVRVESAETSAESTTVHQTTLVQNKF